MTRPRRNVHPDANQPQIIKDLTAAGFHVINVSATFETGDILVWGYDASLERDRWALIEIKTDTGQLTREQWTFMRGHEGAIDVCRTTEDVMRVFGRVR